MKKIKLIAILGAGLLLFSGCDTFLDTTPDNRAEVDTAAKVKQLLVSAYPDNQVCAALEYSTDNVMDNG
ncbi:MAG: carbohydrate-binding protein, partial [Bacteroidaceae bacterium]